MMHHPGDYFCLLLYIIFFIDVVNRRNSLLEASRKFRYQVSTKCIEIMVLYAEVSQVLGFSEEQVMISVSQLTSR